ncbi:hypothetical protein M422DRAFT_171537, partial [Sphaerobolus stellatus SS14]
DRDSNMFKLLQAIHGFCIFVYDAAPTEVVLSQQKILQKIMEQIIDCSQFISSYCKDRSFALKAVKHIFSNVDDAIKKYILSFEKLKIAFTDAATVLTQLSVINLTASLAALHIDINLNDMPYAEGARYKSGKCCIQGTRVEVLDAITQWAFDEEPDSNICLLLGPAGAGKSAIAHSIARIFDDLGRLGSSFCFIRGDSSRRLELYLPTLARDLADRDQHIKRALGHVLEATSLRKTDDLQDQFDHFIVKTVQGCSIIGPILLVIDALDECGDGKPRKEFLKVLKNPETIKKLPSNFRIFITSRPDQDVQELFSKMHILQLQDKQYRRNVDKDIFSFVQHELMSDPVTKDLTKDHHSQVVKNSEGLFQWASVACQVVQDAANAGQFPAYALEQILSAGSGLYGLYATTLNNRFKMINDPRFSQHFKSVLGFVLSVSQPLPKKSLIVLWTLVFGKDIASEMDHILPHLGSLFNGIGDTSVISPIHTSVRDFFTSPKDSGAFFINIKKHHFDISLGLLHLLNKKLSFNICQIQTSYYRNSDIKEKEAIQGKISPELSYACKFLGIHLQELSDADKQDKRIHPLLKEFLEKKLLFWLEVLALLKKIDCAIFCLLEILPLVKFDTKLESLSRDAIKFVRMASPVIEEASPHLYLSAFNFIPENSILYEHFSKCFSQRARVSTGQEAQWQALEVTLRGHTHWVNSVTFSPDGQRVVSGCDDKTIRIWNAHTGELVSGPFKGHTSRVTSVAFSPDGQRVVSGSADKTIRIWNAHTGELVSEPFKNHTNMVTSVAFSPDGQRVVSGSSDKTIKIWSVHTGELISRPFQGHINTVTSVAFSPDGQRVASGSADKTIRIWNAYTGELISGPFEGPSYAITSVAFSPDGQRVVSGSDDKTIRIWNTHSGELVSGPFEGHTNGVTSVAFSIDGQRVVSGSADKTIRIWNAHTGELISGPFKGSADKTIRIWNAHTEVLTSEPFEGHTSRVTSVAFSPDGQRVVSGSADKTIRIWNSQTGELISRPFHGHTNTVTSVAFSPDGQRVVSGSDDMTIRIWNAHTGNLVSGLLQGHRYSVTSVAFSPDGQRVVSGSADKTIRIWNTYTGELASRPFEGHTSTVTSLVSRPFSHTNMVTSVAFSPDGQWVVSGSDDATTGIWNAHTGELVSGPFKGHTYSVTSVAFSPDGQRVVSGSDDKTIWIWNAHTGRVSGPFQGHTDSVTSVAFSPDGQRVVSGSDDKTIRVWNAHIGEVSGLFQGHTNMVTSASCLDTQGMASESHKSITSLDSISFNKATGWILGPNDELILWIPFSYRERLWLPCYLAIMGINTVTLDLSQFVHGPSWTDCWKGQ